MILQVCVCFDLAGAGVGPIVFVPVTFCINEVSEPGIICFDSEEHSILVILAPQLNARCGFMNGPFMKIQPSYK